MPQLLHRAEQITDAATIWAWDHHVSIIAVGVLAVSVAVLWRAFWSVVLDAKIEWNDEHERSRKV